MALEIGDLIDQKYRVTRLIGKGGMGAVYEGEHILVERRVAIKVLQPVAEQARAMARFEQEARAAGRIGNEHILDIYDMGKLADGSPYLVAEYLDGETLRERIHRVGRLSPQAAVPLLLELLDGLAAAHRAGIVHRDLKPENVFLVRKKAGDFLKLIDFGVSRFEPAGQSEGLRLTTTGAVVGTPSYLSPEQARGRREVDARSDLFSVGIMLYEMVTGEVPFKAESFNDLLFQIVLEPLKPPEQIVADLDPVFSGIIVKALAKDPDERFQSADEFAKTLNAWASGGEVSLPSSPGLPVPLTAAVSAVSGEGPETPTVPDAPRQAASPDVVPAPTPNTFGTSQFAQTSPRNLRLRWPPTRVIGALAVLGIAFGVAVGFSFMRGTGPAAVESAVESNGLRVRSGEREVPLVIPASAPWPSASSAPEASAAAPPAKPTKVVTTAPARLPQPKQKASTMPSATPSVAPAVKRRRDFGY